LKAHSIPVEPSYGAVWGALGKEVQYEGFTVRRLPAAHGFAVSFHAWLGKSVDAELSPDPIRVVPGGLEDAVGDGVQLLDAGGMGERRVVRVEPWMPLHRWIGGAAMASLVY
jgi:hypothetical protein